MKIGSVSLSSPVLLAPMAGITDFPFRKTVKNFGAGLVVSEMVASRTVLEAIKHEKIRQRLHFFEAQREAGPVSVQLVGYDPSIMAEAARFNEQLGVDLLDINMGCPVKKVVNTEAGAALMKDETLAANIIRAVVDAVRIPVTVKMRLGWDQNTQNAASLAKIAENEGAAAVTVHGRTRSQFYEGRADWEAIGDVKKAVSLPVIGNGDVVTETDAQNLLKISGCDAVMVGRGAWGKPWILHHMGKFLAGGTVPPPPTGEELYQVVLAHMALILDYYGAYRGVRIARKHLSWYSKGRTGSAPFRAAVNACDSEGELLKLVEHFKEVEAAD